MNKDVGHDLITVLGMSPSDVSLTLSLFYVSYIIFDFPSNLVMSRVGPRAWMARIVMATGIVGACFAAVQDPWSAKYIDLPLRSPPTPQANHVTGSCASSSAPSSPACGPACPST